VFTVETRWLYSATDHPWHTRTFGALSQGQPGHSEKPERKIKFWNSDIGHVTKLGVILDISGSAHGFLSAAINEVEKNFDHNPTLLVMGCGMNPSVKASDVKVELLGRSKPTR